MNCWHALFLVHMYPQGKYLKVTLSHSFLGHFQNQYIHVSVEIRLSHWQRFITLAGQVTQFIASKETGKSHKSNLSLKLIYCWKYTSKIIHSSIDTNLYTFAHYCYLNVANKPINRICFILPIVLNVGTKNGMQN